MIYKWTWMYKKWFILLGGLTITLLNTGLISGIEPRILSMFIQMPSLSLSPNRTAIQPIENPDNVSATDCNPSLNFFVFLPVVISNNAGDPEVGNPEAGEGKFGTCAACHGPVGEGGLGTDLTTSEFVACKSDEELVDFIKVGRSPSDPDNTTGIEMPPRGGNPALTDEDLFDIVAYIRTLQK